MIAEIVLFITLVGLLYFHLSRPKNTPGLPPAVPWKLPFVGHLLSLGLHPHEKLHEWTERYGPVFRVQFGSYAAVVISEGPMIRRAFASSATAGRQSIKIFDEVSMDRKGLLFTDGPQARDQRFFFMKNLKELTAQAESMEWRIQGQIDNLKDRIEKSAGQPLSVRHFFNRNIVNALFSVVISRSFEPGDEKIDHFTEAVTSCISLDGIRDMAGIFLPTLSDWFPDFVGYTKRIKICRELQGFMQTLIDEHKATWIKGQPRDLIDIYFDKSDDVTDPHSGFHHTSPNLLISMFDLFIAGSETTSTQMEWIIYCLAKYPEVQEKLQQEIDRVIGDRPPAIHDRTSLTYAEAVVIEVCRYATLVPLGLPHSTTEECEIIGYRIPKNTIIVGNLYSAHHSRATWGDPEAFRPERFLDEDGKIMKNEAMVPFSWGKRSCIGETLARQQMFLYTVSILQKYSIQALGKLPSSSTFGITAAPLPFSVIFNHRASTRRTIEPVEEKVDKRYTFSIAPRQGGHER